MSIRLINDENELYVEQNKSPGEIKPVPISIKGLKLPPEEIVQVESEIQQVVAEEFIRRERAQLEKARTPEAKHDIHVSLKGLNLPDEVTRSIESRVQQMVLERVRARPHDDGDGGGGGGGGGTGGGGSCVCAGNIPGETQSFVRITPMPQPPFTAEVSFTGNTLIMRVDPGVNLSSNEMMVGLASRVDWAKEIMAWSICRGRLSSVYQEGSNSTPNFMLLRSGCNQTDTIVFRKPRFLGIWVDEANYDFTRFWDDLGGKKVTFTWVKD